MDIFTNVFVQLGAVGLLIVYLMQRDRKNDMANATRERQIAADAKAREERMATRLDLVEDFQRTEMRDCIDMNTKSNLRVAARLGNVEKRLTKRRSSR